MRVRAKNAALFVVIAFSIVSAYFILEAIVNSWLTPLPTGMVSANAMLLHHLPGFLVAYGVLAAGGMALAMFVDSAVPLKWCLGLGAIFALLYLSVGIFGLVKYAATGASLAPSVLVMATISFSYLVVPIVGGYLQATLPRRSNRSLDVMCALARADGGLVTIRAQVRAEVASIRPFDELEETHLADALAWIDSGAPLCRIAKPATPPKHLVSYFAVVDGDHILLVDHKSAQLWLPTGGMWRRGSTRGRPSLANSRRNSGYLRHMTSRSR